MRDSTGSVFESYQIFFRLQNGIGAFFLVIPGLGQSRDMSHANPVSMDVGWWFTVILDIVSDQ